MDEPLETKELPPPEGKKAGHRLFGEIALAMEYITAEQVRIALEVQEDLRRMDMPEKIGQILIKRGILSRKKVLAILKEQGVKPIQEIIEGFEILEKIGQGGMGAVFRARQVSTDREVALKILPPRFNRDTTFLKRFLREAKVAAQLNHPNIVQCIDAGASRGHHFIAMEFIGGEDVESSLRARGRLPEEEALQVAEQVARALDHAHRKQLIHRDIKPSNIMFAEDGTAKLLDLGLAKAVGTGDSTEFNRITQTGVAVGTPSYISPEQAQGNQAIDIRADIYSMGATLYHMVTGKAPFSAPSAAGVLVQHISAPVPKANEAVPSVSDATTQLIEIMMAKSPGNRFDSPASLLEAILGAREGTLPKRPVTVPGSTEAGGSDSASRVPNTLGNLTTSVRSGVEKTADVMGREVKGWFRSPFFLAAAGGGLVLIAASLILVLWGPGSHNKALGPEAHDPKAGGPAPEMNKVPEKTNGNGRSEGPAAGEPEPAEPAGEPDPEPAPVDPESARVKIEAAKKIMRETSRFVRNLEESRDREGRLPKEILSELLLRLEDLDRMTRDLDALQKKMERAESAD